MNNEAASPDLLAVAARVREIMSRHGIGKRQQTTELCRILSLSFSQGHRKLSGNSPWTLAQLKKVAEAFSEPAAQLFSAHTLDPGMVGASAQEALFCIGSLTVPCTAWVGAPLEGSSRPEFVAFEQQGQWRVVQPSSARHQKTIEVHKVEIYPRPHNPEKSLVAIIDRDPDTAEALRHYLEQSDFAVAIFQELKAFVDATQTQLFDAVVTDWLFGQATATQAIEAVRHSENADAPIFLLTGDLLTGRASESEISEVIRRFDVACYEKPARLAILVADLTKRLRRT